jgi:hypothetical protein
VAVFLSSLSLANIPHPKIMKAKKPAPITDRNNSFSTSIVCPIQGSIQSQFSMLLKSNSHLFRKEKVTVSRGSSITHKKDPT